MKSKDTEEWLDIHFTRPVGLIFTLFWQHLGVHPNVITILSIFLGVSAAYCFYFVDLWHNIMGIIFLVFANLCDSTDGQLARLTNQKSFIGRVLDGFSGDVWFFCIYSALSMRMFNQPMPHSDTNWGYLIWALAAVAGLLCHSQQSSLSDYYRQIHLYFIKGKAGSELDTYAQQQAIYHSLSKGKWLKRLFYYNYAKYCRSQEHRTPAFQIFFQRYQANPREDVKKCFIEGSRPLMPYTNILTFNLRAICLYITCLLNIPWLYFVLEITAFQLLYIYMHKQHESLCKKLTVILNHTKE